MKTYYWIAINGASVTMSSLPLPRTITVKPVPQLLLGFDRAEEAGAASGNRQHCAGKARANHLRPNVVVSNPGGLQ